MSIFSFLKKFEITLFSPTICPNYSFPSSTTPSIPPAPTPAKLPLDFISSKGKEARESRREGGWDDGEEEKGEAENK